MRNYKAELPDILESVMDAMTYFMEFESVTDNGDGSWTYSGACDTLHAQVGFAFNTTAYFNGGGTPRTLKVKITAVTDTDITFVSFDSSKIIDSIAVTQVYLYRPYFFHGSPREVNKELQLKTNDAAQKTPMLFLLEDFQEDFKDENESAIERESTFRLFFLTQANFQDWLVDDAYTHAIKPMGRLMQHFIDDLKKDHRFEMDEFEYTKANHTKFGVYIQNVGVEKSLFSDSLAGVELSCTLKIKPATWCACPE